ncbi:hypothetical protein LJC13_00840 [Peptostreptococcaceae bacterium OttesenSCG-928-C18]|nr:hypothetical protein [Peptostreptococcaceae bacterium OttesenSCG-928-C18]
MALLLGIGVSSIILKQSKANVVDEENRIEKENIETYIEVEKELRKNNTTVNEQLDLFLEDEMMNEFTPEERELVSKGLTENRISDVEIDELVGDKNNIIILINKMYT